MKNLKPITHNTLPWFSEKQKEEFAVSSREILDSGQLICGKYTNLLEEKAKKVCKTNYAVAVSSATAAIEIILNYLELNGEEVLVPNNTFISTIYALRNAGATPILVDIDPKTFCIDISDVRNKITPKTRALILVHIAGYIPEYVTELKAFCKDHNITLIEDASHAFGASYQNDSAGGIGFASAISLYPTKIVTGGTGGILTTNDGGLAEFALLCRAHGNSPKGMNLQVSPNWFISEFSALLCFLQISELSEILIRRNRVADSYDQVIKRHKQLFQTQPHDDRRIHPYYKYIVKIRDNIIKKKDITEFFQSKNIELGHCYETTLSEHLSTKNIFRNQQFPNSQIFSSNHFTLPCHTGLTAKETDFICETLEEFVGSHVYNANKK
ncbi:DegT/DnrJ/EryC1/StrS family aminotransferase [Bacillales bacterium AN1005]